MKATKRYSEKSRRLSLGERFYAVAEPHPLPNDSVVACRKPSLPASLLHGGLEDGDRGFFRDNVCLVFCVFNELFAGKVLHAL